jgi:hypothetical protein
MIWKRFADEMPPEVDGTWIVLWPKKGKVPALVQREDAFVEADFGVVQEAGWYNDEGLGGNDLVSHYSHWCLVEAPSS